MKKNIKYLIEKHIDFDVIDYSEDEDELMSSQEVEKYITMPKSRDELCQLIAKRYELNPEYPYLLDIDTSQITDMSGVFCPIFNNGILEGNIYLNKYLFPSRSLKVKALDLSTWDTSNVTDMSNMFWAAGERYLEEINISSFDTSNVMKMDGMFGFLSVLKTLDLSNFDTSKVIKMNSMFSNCESIRELDLSNFDTSKVINMYAMFRECFNLVSLNIDGWNTSNVENFRYMFHSCNKLTNIDFSNISLFNSQFGLQGTFQGNKKLKAKFEKEAQY